MQIASYKGYGIEPRPNQLVDGGWTTSLQISRDHGSHINVVAFCARNVWPSRDEAVLRCLRAGMQIVDGKVQGCSVEDL